MSLRPYQQKLKADIQAAWAAGHRNVLAVLPTGGGKTKTFADIIAEEIAVMVAAVKSNRWPAVAIAHRQELVTQISMALAREGVRHRIIGPKPVIKLAVRLHMEELGRSFYDPMAKCAVAGIDTLINRDEAWFSTVSLWVMDEGHHILADNKWGKGALKFPNARGLGVTATPVRADGKGLGRHYDGLMDVMVEGPSMRDLINMGYLTDYRIFAPPSDLDLSGVGVSATTGDYSKPGVVKAVRKSHIVGDIVEHYKKLAPGKKGIIFTTDLETSEDIAKSYGPRALDLSGKSTDFERINGTQRLQNGELDCLTNVDLFGEGYDVPAVEVASLGRPTQSLGLYIQQCGRALRPVYAPGYDLNTVEGRLAAIAAGPKPKALIIDHVGNVLRHGLPDAPRKWSLDRRDKKGRSGPSDVMPVKACPACTGVYERFYPACPFCGHKPEPAGRSKPEFVDGDLTELDGMTLAAMRGAVDEVDKPLDEVRADLMAKHAPEIGVRAGVKRHRERQDAQAELRHAIAVWAGAGKAAGRSDSEMYRLFYLTFGVDVLSAKALGAKDANELKERINGSIMV